MIRKSEIITYVIILSICLGTLLWSTFPVKADTMVCQYANAINPRSVLVYRETNDKDAEDAIKEVDRLWGRIIYYDGRMIDINLDLLQCHLVNGKNDAAERRIVEDFIFMLNGGLE